MVPPLWNQAWRGLLQVGVCASGPSSSARSGSPAVVFGVALGSLSVPVHPRVAESAGVFAGGVLRGR